MSLNTDSPGPNNKKSTITINNNIIVESIETKRLKNERRLIKKYYINIMNFSLIKKTFF
jgi:hypothetical protein